MCSCNRKSGDIGNKVLKAGIPEKLALIYYLIIDVNLIL
jgi:hypothetical protein